MKELFCSTVTFNIIYIYAFALALSYFGTGAQLLMC